MNKVGFGVLTAILIAVLFSLFVSSNSSEEEPESNNLVVSEVEHQVPNSVLELESVQTAMYEEADRQRVTVSEVQVSSYEEVTWSDGSIGCPEEGMAYTQALVPGYRLILEVPSGGNAAAHYHSAGPGDFNYCSNPQRPIADTVEK